MEKGLDLLIDVLADAPLSAEQRRVWDSVRKELAILRAKNLELQARIQEFEQHKDTGQAAVLNRNDFNREVARMLAFDERYGGVSSILYFDFDGLDAVPGSANAALRAIASVLSCGVRSSDIIGRLAGDEFGVLLMRCDNVNAWRKAEALSASIQAKLAEISGGQPLIGINFGAYTFRDNEDLSTGLKEAAQSITHKE